MEMPKIVKRIAAAAGVAGVLSGAPAKAALHPDSVTSRDPINFTVKENGSEPLTWEESSIISNVGGKIDLPLTVDEFESGIPEGKGDLGVPLDTGKSEGKGDLGVPLDSGKPEGKGDLGVPLNSGKPEGKGDLGHSVDPLNEGLSNEEVFGKLPADNTGKIEDLRLNTND